MADNKKATNVASRKHIARLEREKRQVRLVRTIAIVMSVVIIILLGYGYYSTTYLVLRKPVAEVNGENILLKEWQERVQMERINLSNQYQNYLAFQSNYGMDLSQQLQELQNYLQFPSLLGDRVLNQMIDDKIVEQEAEKLGVTVSDQEVEDEIRAAFQFFPNGTATPTITATTISYPTAGPIQLTLVPPTSSPTRTLIPTTDLTLSVEETLAVTSTSTLTITPTSTARPATPTFVPEDITATPTPYTIEGFETEYQSTIERYLGYGVSEETLRNAFRMDLLRKRMTEAVTQDIPTTKQQVWARHILVDDEETANKVVDLLKGGADFAELAKEYSKDTGSAANGGDLSWFGEGAMVAEFEAAAFSQSIGEIGEPVQSQFGYHIIQVIDRAEIPLTTAQLQQERNTAFSDWLVATRETADITTYDFWVENMPPPPNSQ